MIATIHQPSTLMFQNFDKLIVLKKGQTVYHDEASKIVSYMQNLDIKVDYRMNPADFFMLELSQYKESEGHKTKMNAYEWQELEKKSRKGLGKSFVLNEQLKIDFSMNKPTPLK